MANDKHDWVELKCLLTCIISIGLWWRSRSQHSRATSEPRWWRRTGFRHRTAAVDECSNKAQAACRM